MTVLSWSAQKALTGQRRKESVFPKKLREISKLARATISLYPCSVCMRPGPSDPDHYQTKGAGGGDTLDNLISLCRECHTARHKLGVKSFYGPVKKHMIDQRRKVWNLPPVKWKN